MYCLLNSESRLNNTFNLVLLVMTTVDDELMVDGVAYFYKVTMISLFIVCDG